MIPIPPDLRAALSNRVLSDIQRWWTSLTPEQQLDISEPSEPRIDECISQLDIDDLDPAYDYFPIYEYLVNHEMRTVGFVSDAQKDSFHKIATTYLAALGSDYRHGDRGAVG